MGGDPQHVHRRWVDSCLPGIGQRISVPPVHFPGVGCGRQRGADAVRATNRCEPDCFSELTAYYCAMSFCWADNVDAWKNVKPDYVAVYSCLVAFFVTFFTFVLLET